MAWSSHLAKSAIAGFLVMAPIGDTTVLLLFSLSLQTLLTVMLIRERRSRLGAISQSGGTVAEIPFSALSRTAPHLRAHRPAMPRGFVIAGGS